MSLYTNANPYHLIHYHHRLQRLSWNGGNTIYYNRIILIGTILDRPQEMYDTDANRYVYLSLKVVPPPDAPRTHWGGTYDLQGPDWPTGDDTFLVVCRDFLLAERCLKVLRKGDLLCVEGRLVLTLLHSDGDLLPLAEILASDVILLKEAEEVD